MARLSSPYDYPRKQPRSYGRAYEVVKEATVRGIS